jgi:hypothetical protein
VELAGANPGLFMLHVLQRILVMFQRFPLSPGSSVRHGCNMQRNHFRLLQRRGVFANTL